MNFKLRKVQPNHRRVTVAARFSSIQPPLFSMCFLMARGAEGDLIFGSVIAQLAPRLNVMDLKILQASGPFTTPAVSL